MKRGLIFYLVFVQILFLRFGFCQGVSNIWILGHDTLPNQNTGRTIIDFNGGLANVSAINSVPINFLRTCATIADSSGNLLFYTNGFDICNRYGGIMPNGSFIDSSSLMVSWRKYGLPFSQGALILPSPGVDSLYYLFHETEHDFFYDTAGIGVFYPNCLYYSVIDMKSDSGRGDLIIREQPAFYDTLTHGRLTAVKHANGRDWWIVIYRYEGDSFIKLLLTPQGLSAPMYQNIGPRLSYIDLAQAVFTPEGEKYATVDAYNGILLMDFDRCDGSLSNPVNISINDSSALRGAAFSPNGRYLYVSSTKYLYQYDTWAGNIAGSKVTVAVWDGFYSPAFPFAATFYTMQLAPDDKIYIASPNSVKVLHVINRPDSAGLACDVCQHCISLPTYNAFTVPNHINYFLGADSGSVCDTLQLGIQNGGFKIQNEKLSIFPNPATDNIQLAFTPYEKQTSVEIIDLNGKIVLKINISQWSQRMRINISKLNAGIYLCRLVGGKEQVAKFVVKR